jgi:hypothetical protein
MVAARFAKAANRAGLFAGVPAGLKKDVRQARSLAIFWIGLTGLKTGHYRPAITQGASVAEEEFKLTTTRER